MNTIRQRPGAPTIVAPAPFAGQGRVVVQRQCAFVPDGMFDQRASRDRGTLRALRRRYPHAIRKTLAYLRTEGLSQTWSKFRTRTALTRLEQSSAAFAATGIVVDAPGTTFSRGMPVLCWSWHGPVDADYHLVGPSQCLSIPALSPHIAAAPYVAWIANVVRSLNIEHPSLELRGLPEWCMEPLVALIGGTRTHGPRVIVGCGPQMDDGTAGHAIVIRLSDERGIDNLVEATAAGYVCRLPEPSHYFLDSFYPEGVEHPWPFTRATVEEAAAILARTRTTPAAVAPPPPSPDATMMVLATRAVEAGARTGVSCLGAGNYVRAILLHHLRRHRAVDVRGVMDVRPDVAAVQGRALDACYCTTDPSRVLGDPDTDLILIASDHASHADYAIAALEAGKAVHLEKPPAVTVDQLNRLIRCLREAREPRLHLGYNRPYAPAIQALWPRLEPLTGATSVVCHVRGYRLNRSHWYRWPNQGTRVAGNLVHWIDLGYRLCGRQRPVAVDVRVPDAPAGDPDALDLFATFEDGSSVEIHFSSNEHSIYGMREEIVVTRQDLTAHIDDFLALTISEHGRHDRRTFPRDKGHAANMAALASLRVDLDRTTQMIRDLELTGAIQFAAERALHDGGGRITMT